MDYNSNIKYIIRQMHREEYPLLNDFLYEAIYISDGMEPPPKRIRNTPELQEYVVDFGTREHDKAFAAEIEGMIAGGAWVRIMHDYGHIDDDAHSIAIAVRKAYRGLGIGTTMLKELFES
ncbi:GNAT family N-acetyltransferase [Candidatus Merdisoma sp. JLR.KK006]|uniref:GNAT family N-acetyltransferase n=1 Tax=Candidatus Merdisoma sp. JLR.KK006 TaxID=3112626 RepID=UPI002FF293E9